MPSKKVADMTAEEHEARKKVVRESKRRYDSKKHEEKIQRLLEESRRREADARLAAITDQDDYRSAISRELSDAVYADLYEAVNDPELNGDIYDATMEDGGSYRECAVNLIRRYLDRYRSWEFQTMYDELQRSRVGKVFLTWMGFKPITEHIYYTTDLRPILAGGDQVGKLDYSNYREAESEMWVMFNQAVEAKLKPRNGTPQTGDGAKV